MLKMVDGTGIIGVDMICPLGVSAPQPPNYDRVELEGTGMLVLPNSLDAPLERLELGGKTEQVQTRGAQLITLDNRVDVGNTELGGEKWITKISEQAYSVYNNYQKSTVEFMENNSFKLSHNTGASSTNGNGLELPVKIKPDTDYTLSYTSSISEVLVYFIQMDSGCNKLKETSSRNKKHTFHSEANAEWVILKFASVLNNSYVVSNIQFEKGTVATSFEPYSSGKASPSPEYQQEIKSVGKWNEEKQKYEVSVKVTGKNLFDIEKAEVSGGNLCTAKRENNIVKITAIETVTSKRAYVIVSGGGICLKSGKTYFLNGRKVGTSNMTPMFAFFKEKNNGELLKMGNFYTPNEDICIDIGIYLVGDAIRTGNTLEITDIIVCEGKDAAQYQPYKEQTLTITSDRPLTKWDRLVEQGGEYGWLYGSVIATIDETADISLYAPNGFYICVKNIDKKEKTGYCDKLYTKKMSNGEPFVLFGLANNNFLYTLNTQEFYGKTASEIKAKLKEYPLNIIGKSETTEFAPLPQSEQNAIRALKTYYPTTVITVDGGELDPDIKVTYRKEI